MDTLDVGLKWSDWRTWSTVEAEGGAPAEAGVYRVRATESPGVALPIPRALGVDEEGIVYIGSGMLQVRIGRLLPSTSGKRHHDLGRTYEYYGFDKLCPYEQLEVQWATVAEEHDAPEVEGLLGKKYICTFVSLPPGNMIAPGQSPSPA